MKSLLRSRRAIAAAAVLLVASAAWLLADGPDRGPMLTATVAEGDFEVTVTSAGELRATAFVEIQGPANAQQAGAFQMKIASIVPEGTLVTKGDVVAELDRSTLATKLQETALNVQKAEAQYEQAMLDSTLTLSKAREDLRTMELALEEKRIAREQAKFEAPSVQRQAEIDYEKAERALEQGRRDLVTRTEQAQAKMREVGADLERQRNLQRVVMEVMDGFTVRAPSDGMVIYVREWNGRKKGSGAQINPWEPAVATLPDLSRMESITYVNEVDVRKVAVGQPVRISLDADPERRLDGEVASVANVGEQRPNSDAKVFEVKITVSRPDTTLRPGMTTGNVIRTSSLTGVLSIPLEAIVPDASTPFVFVRRGGRIVRQEVATGAMNDTHVVITAGLVAGEGELLVAPADAASVPTERLADVAR
ncbi:MAG TPA: efflux RND transporter periplasmic adaptor subunit [Gemmatimonadaceae bacterium]|nr:efflux RND transporter periplasmic adaptor subunit [Gemmatimonadaceae bacterium]